MSYGSGYAQPYMPGLEGAAFEVPDPQRRKALSQWFTPAELAERTWRWMLHGRELTRPRVLEPAAGHGALIRPLLALDVRPAVVVAYEVDPQLAAQLPAACEGLPLEVRCRDFLTAEFDGERFDIAVMNPPYEDGADVAFADRALGCCALVGGIFAARMTFSVERADFWRWTDIRRQAVLSRRPRFGGDFQPMTDFVVLELQRRERARLQGEPSACAVEWW